MSGGPFAAPAFARDVVLFAGVASRLAISQRPIFLRILRKSAERSVFVGSWAIAMGRSSCLVRFWRGAFGGGCVWNLSRRRRFREHVTGDFVDTMFRGAVPFLLSFCLVSAGLLYIFGHFAGGREDSLSF